MVNTGKETAMLHYRRLGLTLRCNEACAALSWCSARLLGDAASLLLAPAFVFLLGNAIVLVLALVLLAKFPHHTSSSGGAADLLHLPDRDSALVVEAIEEVPEIRRTRSVGATRKPGLAKKELRRAETVVVGRIGVQEGRESVEMSPEEFQRRVEAFIAKQRWFQEEEEETLGVVAVAWTSASPEQLILAES